MGATVFSERFSTRIIRATTGALLQNVGIGVVIPNTGDTVARILGIAVITDDFTRLTRVNVTVQEPTAPAQEFPVWVWDQTNALSLSIQDAGVTAVHNVLVGSHPLQMLPTFMSGTGQREMVDQVIMRGLTAGFGAGNVTVTALIYVAFSELGGLSSRGLPIPSW